MTSPHQTTWNHGVPPPPPPPRPPGYISYYPSQGDVGNICPPPPPPQQILGHQTPHQFPSNGIPTQAKTHQQIHQPSANGYPQNMGFANQNGQQFVSIISQYPQQQPYQYQPQQNYQQYQQYINYSIPPPPPPPPRHHSNQGHQCNKSHGGKLNLNGNRKNKNPSDPNSEVAASLRQSLGANNNNKQKPANYGNNRMDNSEESNKKKQVNPKMVKKYSGSGLKTITISGPGLPPQKFKICVGNHPDDVKKWIEERKKRFPRRSADPNSSHKSSIETDSRKRGRENGEATELSFVNHRMNKKQCEGKVDEDEDNGCNLSSLLAGYESSSSKEDDSKPSKKTATYEQNDETTESKSLEDMTASNSLIMKDMFKTGAFAKERVCRFYQRGDCRHGSSCTFLHCDKSTDNHAIKATSQSLAHRKAQSEKDRARIQRERELQILGLANPSHGTRGGTGKFINSTSLLNKLLQRDMERERRLTLQMLRYIVDNNFFQNAAVNDCDGGDENEPKNVSTNHAHSEINTQEDFET